MNLLGRNEFGVRAFFALCHVLTALLAIAVLKPLRDKCLRANASI